MQEEERAATNANIREQIEFFEALIKVPDNLGLVFAALRADRTVTSMQKLASGLGTSIPVAQNILRTTLERFTSENIEKASDYLTSLRQSLS